MIGTIVHQLIAKATPQQLRDAGIDASYVDHGLGIYPQTAAGVPFSAATIQSTGNPVADLYENMAADGAVSK